MTSYKIPTVKDYDKLLEYLFRGTRLTGIYSEKLGIERMQYFMSLLGNPQEKIKTIHIAGTSGKGSTSYMIDSLLRSSGKKVGLVVSPHVYDYRERMHVNGKYVSKKIMVEAFNTILPAIKTVTINQYGPPTFFELNIALAYTLFAHYKLDYIVLETGVGGLCDLTNTIQRSNKLAVITKLGLDHTVLLGDTIADIAYQKRALCHIAAWL